MLIRLSWTSDYTEQDHLEVPDDIQFVELMDMIDKVVEKHGDVYGGFKWGYIINKTDKGYDVEVYNDYRE